LAALAESPDLLRAFRVLLQHLDCLILFCDCVRPLV
jgi:hypothetical protein